MIDPAEIEAKAREYEINTSNVQRDYVFGWLLFGFFTKSALKDRLFLKGGNALRKGYFSNTRYSADLDFGIADDIGQEELLTEINAICAFVQNESGVAFLTDDTKVEEKFTATDAPIVGLRVWDANVYFRDFYGKAKHIRLRVSMDVTRFDRTMLPIQSRALIHPYSDAAVLACHIRVMKLEEIIATKLKCILQRQHAPDLYDYVYSIRLLGGELDREEIARTFIKKTIFERNPHVLKDILIKTPLDHCRETWQKVIVSAKTSSLDVEESIALFIQDLTDLFALFPESAWLRFEYFGADLRVPIMRAGRTQTLLKMRYKGEDRLVEPYSLSYKQRRDGAEREYFYAYNVSGGRNLPGWRGFVAEGVDSIDNTETTFEPRLQIELSKAGEHPEERFLFDPNKPARAPNRRGIHSHTRSPRVGRPTYIYQCPFCGKRFSRSTHSSTLNPHKDKNGYRCSGRTGYYVDTKY